MSPVSATTSLVASRRAPMERAATATRAGRLPDRPRAGRLLTYTRCAEKVRGRLLDSGVGRLATITAPVTGATRKGSVTLSLRWENRYGRYGFFFFSSRRRHTR